MNCKENMCPICNKVRLFSLFDFLKIEYRGETICHSCYDNLLKAKMDLKIIDSYSKDELVEIIEKPIGNITKIMKSSDNESPESNCGEARYYVYEWFLKSDGRVFYVGKGTGKRYNHIIHEINNNNKHGHFYKLLQDDFGIDYRIVKDGLHEDEALEFEQDQIDLRKSEGNYLIQYNFTPIDRDLKICQNGMERAKLFETRDFTPIIEVDEFYHHYYGVSN